ncbi:MAG: VOC family protein [Candidatus Thiodiazotropha sp. (ex Ctena orbiculata)]|uniref:VOC family protein n=1 Tax=Candidatus Thiodiazotropha taylori TaxID=2792791 RepID=A0A944M7Z2_9GAMM|nr:VOC family protein [Candidatus Thiodiazotropha taylori]MBV2137811.1 VOC family protein [Candidatus Thiodiazotropha taylori]
MMKLKSLIPMLNVSNIAKSLEFYENALGFQVVSDPKAVEEWRWATIRSGNTELMLSETETNIGLEAPIDPQESTKWPVIVYFYPDSVVQLYQHVENCGYLPTPLITTFYGMKEFSIQDPDGHMLSFGEDSIEESKSK